MNLIEIAKSVGGETPTYRNIRVFEFDEVQLQSFAEAITKEKDAEIESINLEFDSAQQELDARGKEVAMQALEIEQLKYENQELHRDWNQRGIDNIELNAKVAMMREALEHHQDIEHLQDMVKGLRGEI